MGKGRIKRIVGHISHEVAEKYKLYEYEGEEIIQSLDFYSHVNKHIGEFESLDNFHEVLSNINDIIANPFFVYYDADKKSLQYFYELNEWCCVVVKLRLRKNKDTYVATAYPISKDKIDRYKEKSYIIK